MDDLDRMFRCLMQVLSSSYPQYLTHPFEVAELYQNLIPYRHRRAEMRIDTNQDYEVALCRLLSGERGYLTADDALTQAMREELASPNPNTATFRDFAASRVALGPRAQKRWQEMGGAGGGDQSLAQPTSESRVTPMPPPPPPVARNESAVHSTTSRTASDDEVCRYCGGRLPQGRPSTFCPHCGQNLTIQRCPACGTELEIDWKFCITCGRGVAAS